SGGRGDRLLRGCAAACAARIERQTLRSGAAAPAGRRRRAPIPAARPSARRRADDKVEDRPGTEPDDRTREDDSMSRLILPLALIALAGCQSTDGSLGLRKPSRAGDPMLSIEQQKYIGREK